MLIREIRTSNILLKLSNDASSNSGSKSGKSGLGKGGKLNPELCANPCEMNPHEAGTPIEESYILSIHNES